MSTQKEWTLMFFMASDNPLAISIVSQLKALKAAGWHKDVNVIAQFDPFTEGTPTHIFDVNLVNKLKDPVNQSKIGFKDDDALVPTLIEDKLWRDETTTEGDHLIRDEIKKIFDQAYGPECEYKAPMAPELNGTPHPYGVRRQELDVYTSLRRFINFCAEKYPAKHYMLFMIGHGVVVGNDVFMYDEHAEQKSLTLGALGDILREFKDKLGEQEPKSEFDLISFHSCSVSSIEVAYELKDTANYMLASQGPTFVGSWPYRQILMRIFRQMEPDGKDKSIEKLVKDIFSFCFHNCSDFLLAGYSHQVTLCDLRKIHELNKEMEDLSSALFRALTKEDDESADKAIDSASKFVILFAHWRAQSFYNEMYTDIYDFCRCVMERCERIEEAGGMMTDPLKEIKAASDALMKRLKPGGQKPSPSDQTSPNSPIIVQAQFAGPGFQYSNGLSIYFPWTEPSEDSQILQQYDEYKFSQQFKTPWLDFLKAYFKETRRSSKRDELLDRHQRKIERGKTSEPPPPMTAYEVLQEDIGSLIYSGEGPLGSYALKGDPEDKQGGNCDCTSFKNYARDTRARGHRSKRAQKMPVGQTLLGRFEV